MDSINSQRLIEVFIAIAKDARNSGDQVLSEWYALKPSYLPAWNSMTDAERWTANLKFLDRTVDRGDAIKLPIPASAADPRGSFIREIDYLKSRGYSVSSDGLSLLAPKK